MIKLKLAIIALIIIGAQHVYSQGGSVNGTVTDGANIPLPGVTVLIKGVQLMVQPQILMECILLTM